MLTKSKYIYAALHHKVCHVPRETIEHVALFHVKQLAMLHRTICFVALHNVALQYVASQHDVALQHRTMLQRSYRTAPCYAAAQQLLQRNSQGEGGGGPCRGALASGGLVNKIFFIINILQLQFTLCKPPSTPQTKRWL